MTSSPDRHDYAPMGDAEKCAICENDILTMAYKGTGVCGQKCLAVWRKAHPLPPALQITKDDLEMVISNLHMSQRKADHIWKVLNGDA